VIEDEVVIGMGATILNNSRIGAGSIIAAGAVVPEHTVVPPRSLWAGVPAKMRRELGERDRALIREYAQNYWTMWRFTARKRETEQAVEELAALKGTALAPEGWFLRDYDFCPQAFSFSPSPPWRLALL